MCGLLFGDWRLTVVSWLVSTCCVLPLLAVWIASRIGNALRRADRERWS